MCDVILFAGTDEGHKIADFLRENNINHIVCVATEYGAKLLKGCSVHVGRMDAVEMKIFFDEKCPKIIVDATHPYADKVTKNIRAACKCRYIRVVREEQINAYGKRFQTIREAAEYLRTTEGNVLLTIGSKEISAFSAIAKRTYTRVLPTESSVKACIDAGFDSEHIISAAPPFTKDENIAVIRGKNIKYLVTKSTGKSGGFIEKTEAARECGIECLIIERPARETGYLPEDAMKKILEWL